MVVAIQRGRKRALVTVVIALAGNEKIEFRAYPEHRLSRLKSEVIIEQLLQSRPWSALRKRRYSKVANPAVPPIRVLPRWTPIHWHQRSNESLVSNHSVVAFIKETVLALLPGEEMEFRADSYVQIEAPHYRVEFFRFGIPDKYRDE